VDGGDVDGALEPLERPHDERAMRPGAAVHDIEVIAAGLGPKASAGLVAHPLAEARRRQLELEGALFRRGRGRPAAFGLVVLGRVHRMSPDSHQTIFRTHVAYSYIHSNKVSNVRGNLIAPDRLFDAGLTWALTLVYATKTARELTAAAS